MRPSPLRTRRALRRVGLFVMVVTAGLVTGLYWRSARAGDVVRAAISVQIQAAVQADGAVSVTETLTLDPSRLEVEQLVRHIPTPYGTSAVLRGATDGNGEPVAALAGGGSPENLAVRVEVEHHATVALHYTVLGAVDTTDGEAVVTLWWFDNDNALAIDELTASITWPETGDRASAVEGFVGGRRLDGQRTGAGVRFDAAPVPAQVVAGGGAAFDRAAVPGLGRNDGRGGDGLARLVPPAGGAGGVAWDALGVVVGLAVLAGWALLQRLRGRDYPVPADLHETSPPSSHTPAEVGWLLRFGEVRHSDLTATLIDLASRGYVIPYRREGRVVAGHGRPRSGLCPHEELVLDWLFSGDVRRECDLDERNADIRREPEKWAAMWERFVDDVRSVGRSNALVERQADSGAVLGLGFAGLIVVAAGVAGVAASHTGWLACIFAGAAVLAGSTAFARRSPEGTLVAARWEAFGRSLRGEALRALDPPPDLGPQALAYALALHESDAAAAVLDAHQGGDAGARWPTQLIDREIEAHVNRWRVSYLAATSIKGEPSERLRALLSLRALRRPARTRR